MNFPVNFGHAMLMKARYPKAPLPILEAIADHAVNRTAHGHFVTAVLENDLTEAVFVPITTVWRALQTSSAMYTGRYHRTATAQEKRSVRG